MHAIAHAECRALCCFCASSVWDHAQPQTTQADPARPLSRFPCLRGKSGGNAYCDDIAAGMIHMYDSHARHLEKKTAVTQHHRSTLLNRAPAYNPYPNAIHLAGHAGILGDEDDTASGRGLPRGRSRRHHRQTNAGTMRIPRPGPWQTPCCGVRNFRWRAVGCRGRVRLG